MVLTAGRGTRLRPLTLQRAKPAIRLVDRAVVNHALHWLTAQGVDEAVLNLHHLPETVRRVVADGGPPGLEVRWSEETELLGTGGGLAAAAAHFRGEEAFLLVNGDGVCDFELSALISEHERNGAAVTLLLMDHPAGSDFAGVDVAPDGRVLRIAGRPDVEPGPETRNLHYPGVCLLGPRALEALPPDGPSCLFRDTVVPMIEQGALVRGVQLEGRWHEIGTPARYLEATRALLATRGEGPYLAEGASVAPGATLDERCVLGEGARLEAGAQVRGSVLLEGAVAGRGCRILDAVVGYGTWLADGESLERAVRIEAGGRIHTAPLRPADDDEGA